MAAQAQRPPPRERDNTWFILGREPLLAAAELRAVLNLREYAYEPPLLKTPTVVNHDNLIQKLGGTIKIAKELASGSTADDLTAFMLRELQKIEGKIVFGISAYFGEKRPPKRIQAWGLEIKKRLRSEGRPARFVYSGEPALSSAAVKNNGLIGRGREFIISGRNGKFDLALTLAVQPFEELSERDYGRPGRDDVSGMLPPKLAIVMINLAQASKDDVILDPFCGSGTIISEAMLLGYHNLIGSDVSEKAVQDSIKNVRWTMRRFNIENQKDNKINIFECDVKNLSNQLDKESADAIVTEPYLGKPMRGREHRDELGHQARELKELYTIALQQFYKLLMPNGKIVMVVPKFKYKNEWVMIDMTNEAKRIGLEPVPLFEKYLTLTYARPDQWVGREIWRFVKRG